MYSISVSGWTEFSVTVESVTLRFCVIIKSYALLWLSVYDVSVFTITSCMHIQ